MTIHEVASWAKEHSNKFDAGLFTGLLMMGSLNPQGYTLWEGNIYEK